MIFSSKKSLISRYGLGSIGRVGSVMLTLCVTVENYITVCKPFDKVRFQKFFAPCGILFAICYNIPKFFEFEVIYIQDDETNMTSSASNETEEPLDDVTNSTIGNSTVEIHGRPIWSPTNLKNNYWYAKIYFFAIRFLFIEIIPYCIMSKSRCFLILLPNHSIVDVCIPVGLNWKIWNHIQGIIDDPNDSERGKL